jgi:hypothetical protein
MKDISSVTEQELRVMLKQSVCEEHQEWVDELVEVMFDQLEAAKKSPEDWAQEKREQEEWDRKLKEQRERPREEKERVEREHNEWEQREREYKEARETKDGRQRHGNV